MIFFEHGVGYLFHDSDITVAVVVLNLIDGSTPRLRESFLVNEPPQGKPCGIWNVEQFPDRRLVREKIYYTVWFNTKFL
jgi:hypothetical protein